MQSINLLIQTFTQPGDQVIIQPPVFGPFGDAVQNNGRVLVHNPLRYEDGRYSMDLDDLATKAADPQARMIILCSPHNPVGRVWSRDELRRLSEICEQHDVLIVSDEIHSELVYSWATFTTLGVVNERLDDRFVLCHSASKTFNLPGLRTSLTIIPDHVLRQQFLTTMRNLNELFGVNLVGTLALQTAFEQGEDWLGQLMAYVEANYDYLQAYLKRHLPHLRVTQPEALYLIWIDCRALGLSSDALKQMFFDEARVYLESGSRFGAEGEGFVRMNIACPRSILETALERIRYAVEHHASGPHSVKNPVSL
jgi:cystathionine beta-lyase